MKIEKDTVMNCEAPLKEDRRGIIILDTPMSANISFYEFVNENFTIINDYSLKEVTKELIYQIDKDFKDQQDYLDSLEDCEIDLSKVPPMGRTQKQHNHILSLNKKGKK